MKKTETIALYLDDYFNGKSDEEKQSFYEKSIEKQYSAIMAWKRRRDMSGAASNPSSVATILEALKKVKRAIPALDTLSPKDADKIRTALNEIYNDVDNFDKIKKVSYCANWNPKKIERQTENLQRKIEGTRQELN